MTRESKIITSVIILALIAFAIIAIIFIPLPAISTYNQALSVADYKERMGIIYEIEELEKLDKYGEEYSKSFNSVDHMQIINSRKKMFGNGARWRATCQVVICPRTSDKPTLFSSFNRWC